MLSTFSRQVLKTIDLLFGGYGVRLIFYVLVFVLACHLLSRFNKFNLKLLLTVGSVFVSVLWLSSGLVMYEERIHFLHYGLVGATWVRGFYLCEFGGLWRSFLLSVLAGGATAIMDEALQWLLPYRVGDIRDIYFDLIGCMAGSLIFLCYRIFR